jgi:CSLREA domain-containing protein
MRNFFGQKIRRTKRIIAHGADSRKKIKGGKAMKKKTQETKSNLSARLSFHTQFLKTKKRVFWLRLILLVCFAVCITSTARSSTFTVNSTADIQDATPGNFICSTATVGQCTLRAAITEANAKSGDDTIILPAGTYTETLVAIAEDANAGGDFDINSNITITGAGAGSTIIQAASSSNATTERVLHFLSGTSTVSGVTIRHGGTTGGGFGGGIVIEGIFPAQTNVAFDSVTISDNSSSTFGGGIAALNSSTLTMNDSLVTNNFAGGSGGGIYTNLTLSSSAAPTALTNTTVSFNRAVSNSAIAIRGGGISAENFGLILNNCSISDNSVIATTSGAVAEGGGLYGRGIFNNSSINNNTVTATSSAARGGGIRLTGGATINDCSVSNNVAKTSNAVNTSALSSGGGIYAPPDTLNINRTYISGNKADEGGGIRSRVQRRSPPPQVFATYINQSVIINNTGTSLAGGILFEPSNDSAGNEPVAVINNSTIAGNRTNGTGGGIVSRETNSQAAARIDVNYSTVARNVADEDNTGGEKGGGVFVFGTDPNLDASPIYLKGSVVADNSVGAGSTNPDISGPVLSDGYNHVENLGSATFITTIGDVTGSDPLLGALSGNGARSVFIPAMNSPLVDQIPSGAAGCGVAPFDVDQRGAARPADTNRDGTAACEKGAVEIAAPTAALVSVGGRVTANGDESVARAAVTLTDSQGQTRTVLTNRFGYYRFENVAVGETYVFAVNAKTLRFAARVFDVYGETSDLDFAAEAQWKETNEISKPPEFSQLRTKIMKFD